MGGWAEVLDGIIGRVEAGWVKGEIGTKGGGGVGWRMALGLGSRAGIEEGKGLGSKTGLMGLELGELLEVWFEAMEFPKFLGKREMDKE